MTTYDAVFFDSDGVLVEPPERGTQLESTRAAFRSVGVESPDRRHVRDMASDVRVERLEEVCGAYGVEPAAFWSERERHDEEFQFEAFRNGERGCYGDVAAIADLSTPRGVVSNNHHTTVEFVLRFFGLEPLFETYYGREMTVESLRLKKPNTHYLERALGDVDAEDALYVGDSEHDIVAAHRAGVESVFLRRPHARGVDLAAEPTYEIETLGELGRLVD